MNQTTTSIRSGRKGDVVVISGHRVGERERIGEILEVLGEEDRVHYRVRWEDGNESVFYPGSDAAIRRSRAEEAAGEPRTGGAAPSSAVIDLLEASHVSYELLPHRRTMTAAAEARAVGIDPGHVAKTLVLATEEGYVRAVLPASERIDLRKVRAALDVDASLASEQALVGAYPEFELGAVPPVGGAQGDPVLVDRRVRDAGSVVFEAGVHDQSLRMAAGDLVSVAKAQVADICVD
jgi:Ala-tRNA(Pro) deacylase